MLQQIWWDGSNNTLVIFYDSWRWSIWIVGWCCKMVSALPEDDTDMIFCEILWMEEILHQLRWLKPYKSWDKPPIDWWLSSIHSNHGLGVTQVPNSWSHPRLSCRRLVPKKNAFGWRWRCLEWDHYPDFMQNYIWLHLIISKLYLMISDYIWFWLLVLLL